MQKIKELYFTSKGRIGRKSFILGGLGLLFSYILVFGLVLITDAKLQNSQSQSSFGISFLLGILLLISLIMFLIAFVNLYVKRFHDIDLSGWFILAVFLPYIGYLVTLIIAFIPGTQGENRFGDDPIERAKNA